jgi:hypothetical protein
MRKWDTNNFLDAETARQLGDSRFDEWARRARARDPQRTSRVGRRSTARAGVSHDPRRKKQKGPVDEYVVHVQFDTGERAYAAFPARAGRGVTASQAVHTARQAAEVARKWGLDGWLDQAYEQGVHPRAARKFKITGVEPIYVGGS